MSTPALKRMTVFLDTEFTSLVLNPRLLSIGLVAGGEIDQEFYAEVTDADERDAASRFARSVVLPQFGLVAGADCSYALMCARLVAFLEELVRRVKPEEKIVVAFESDIDWALLKRALQDAGGSHYENLSLHLRPANVYNIAGFEAGSVASAAYFDAQRCAAFSRHHALCDARALRIGFEAAHRSTAARRSSQFVEARAG